MSEASCTKSHKHNAISMIISSIIDKKKVPNLTL